MAFKGHEYVNAINASLQKEFGPGYIKDFASPEWRDLAVKFISESYDIFGLAWTQIERNAELRKRLESELLLFEVGTHNGCPWLYGPFRVVDVGRKTLANPEGRVFTDFMASDKFVAILNADKKNRS